MTDVLIPEERPLDELLVKVREKQTLPNVLYSETYVYKPIELQIAQLLTEFPMLKMKSVNVRQIRKRHFPKQAEHYFVIPRLGLVTLTQCEGYLQKLEQLKGCSCPETPDNLRTCFSIKALRNIAVCGWRLEHRPRTLDAMRKIEEQQPGNDLLIVPAQFGARHAGKTFDQTEKSLEENEFALDALSIWMMLLTNPTRLENYSDMAIECGGEIIKSTKANDSKESAVTFTAWKGKLIVASTYVELNYHNQGIATGFIT